MSSKELELTKPLEGLEKGRATSLLENFQEFSKQATSWEKKALAIVITDESQVEGMKEARNIRLELKKIRTNTENTRKILKEDALREGKAIDGIANLIKAVIVPLENHLDTQENYAKIKEEERKRILSSERAEKLRETGADFSSVDLGEISDKDFDLIYQTSIRIRKEEEAAAEKAEADKIAEREAEQEKYRQQQLENDRLAKLAKAETAKREIAEAKIAAHEKALKDKMIAEQKAEESRQTRVDTMSDRELLHEFLDTLDRFKTPEMSSPEGKEMLTKICNAFSRVIMAAQKEVEKKL